MPELLYDVGDGLQFFACENYEIRGEYRAQFGESYLSYEESIRFSCRF